MFEPGKPVPIFMRVLAFIVGCTFLIICGTVLYVRIEAPGAWLTPGSAMRLVVGLIVGFSLVGVGVRSTPPPSAPQRDLRRERPPSN